jgi:hypothetical protein
MQIAQTKKNIIKTVQKIPINIPTITVAIVSINNILFIINIIYTLEDLK